MDGTAIHDQHGARFHIDHAARTHRDIALDHPGHPTGQIDVLMQSEVAIKRIGAGDLQNLFGRVAL